MNNGGKRLRDLGPSPNWRELEKYLTEEALRRVAKVEQVESKLDKVERALMAWCDRHEPHVPAGLTREDIYRRKFKADQDWIDLSGTLKWHMALADMYSGAASAVQGHNRVSDRPSTAHT